MLGCIDTPGYAMDIAITHNERIAYVADGEEGLEIINITNPRKPIIIGNINTNL